jgi:hypothetical protein
MQSAIIMPDAGLFAVVDGGGVAVTEGTPAEPGRVCVRLSPSDASALALHVLSRYCPHGDNADTIDVSRSIGKSITAFPHTRDDFMAAIAAFREVCGREPAVVHITANMQAACGWLRQNYRCERPQTVCGMRIVWDAPVFKLM